jgi:hypothetical protein
MIMADVFLSQLTRMVAAGEFPNLSLITSTVLLLGACGEECWNPHPI